MRELGVQQKKFKDAIGVQVSGIRFTVGLECSAGPQQTDPFQVFNTLRSTSGLSPELAVIDIEKVRCCRGPLDVASHLDEVPSLAVTHGRVGDALEQVDAFN